MKEKFDTRKLRENSELQVKSHDLLSSESSDAHVFYYVRPLRFSKNVWMSLFFDFTLIILKVKRHL